jgi:predicted RNase H-like nuclease (RuvC/YqgF family)
MPIQPEQTIESLTKQINSLTRGRDVDQQKIAKLEAEKKAISERAEQEKTKAKDATARARRVEKRCDKLEKDAGQRAGGTHAVRTTQPRTVAGEHRPAGELLGYLTPCVGNEPIHLVHAAYYRTGMIEPLEEGDAFHDAARGAQAIEQLADAENKASQLRESLTRAEKAVKDLTAQAETLDGRNAELESRVAELEQQLKELAEDAGLGGDGESGGDENES